MKLVSTALLVVLLLSLVHASTVTHPVITLKHGGQVKGTQFQMEKSKVAMFAGIPFAKPPVGNLRFRKPEPAEPWTGTLDGSKNQMTACIQKTTLGPKAGEIIGEEDCLYLDVWVPGDAIPATDKKAVMVWIHGGGYVIGQGTSYPFMVFVDEGDVIVVSINYRLGPFGFLSEVNGTGNFGLWDQRQALVWVQENIDRFGGDPTKVTIFGESAGGGSVSALTLSPHTEGLFHRAISQSGSLYCLWSWATTTKQRVAYNKNILQKFNCTETMGLYDCLSERNAREVVEQTASRELGLPLQHPLPDNDFFDSDTDAWSYNASRRFDVMIGYNGQDGLAFATLLADTFLQTFNKSINDGMPAEHSSQYQMFKCDIIAPLSPELCVHYIEDIYNISESSCDKERLKKVVDIETDVWFGLEARSSLRTHATGGDKSTYGYILAEPHRGVALLPSPDWLKTQADHADDLVFLLGGFKLNETFHLIKQDLYAKEIDDFAANLMLSGLKDVVPMTGHMVRMWTNFAKSGNPNLPVQDLSIPEWHQFTSDTEKVMELKLNPQMVTIPRKDTVQAMQDNIISIMIRRHMEERDLPTPERVDLLSLVSLTTSQASQVIVALLALITVLLFTRQAR